MFWTGRLYRLRFGTYLLMSARTLFGELFEPFLSSLIWCLCSAAKGLPVLIPFWILIQRYLDLAGQGETAKLPLPLSLRGTAIGGQLKLD